jgi:hypothetical protein
LLREAFPSGNNLDLMHDDQSFIPTRPPSYIEPTIPRRISTMTETGAGESSKSTKETWKSKYANLKEDFDLSSMNEKLLQTEYDSTTKQFQEAIDQTESNELFEEHETDKYIR